MKIHTKQGVEKVASATGFIKENIEKAGLLGKTKTAKHKMKFIERKKKILQKN